MTEPQDRARTVASRDRVPFPKKLAYALGGPVDILSVWVLVSIAYPLFNMELELRPLYVSIILMSLRLWDGILDPIIGWISDNARTRFGRRRPFVFVGAILSALTYPLIFWFPEGLSPEQNMFWVIGFGIIFYTLMWGRRLTEEAYWGKHADTLEWTLPNPPPEHTFEILPTKDMWESKSTSH